MPGAFLLPSLFAVAFFVDPNPASMAPSQDDHSLVASLKSDAKEFLLSKNWQEARRCLERTAAIDRDLYGNGSPILANDLQVLGKALTKLKDYDAAETTLSEALSIQEAAWGSDHEGLEITLLNLGVVELERRNLSKSIRVLERCVSILRRRLGGSAREVGEVIYLIGLGYRLQNDRPAAIACFENAMAIFEQSKRAHDVDVESCLKLLADQYSLKHDYQRAVVYGKDLFVKRMWRLGPNDPATMESQLDLANFYIVKKEFESAYPLLQDVLPRQIEHFGDHHRSTDLAHTSLGTCYLGRHDFKRAAEHFQAARAIRIKLDGASSKSVADANWLLGIAYIRAEEYTPALSYLKQSLEFEESRDSNGEDTHRALELMGLVNTLTQSPGSIDCFNRCLDIQMKKYGPNCEKTCEALDRLGSALFRSGLIEPARERFEQSLAVRRQIQGDHHLDTAVTLCNLGRLHFEQARYATARGYLEEAFDIRRNLLGDRHPDTILVANSLKKLPDTPPSAGSAIQGN